jgi:S-methylmethionine-dependent homocysteine/selenocysteine methylase
MEATMSTSVYNTTNWGTKTYIMDGGLETTLIFENGYDLPEFAAFPLLDQDNGRAILRDYYLRYIQVARKNGHGFILEGPTYRASRSRGNKLGYDAAELKRINTEAISFLAGLKSIYADERLYRSGG